MRTSSTLRCAMSGSKLLRYGSGSQVHDLGAIVPAVVWTVVLVAMVAVAYHRRWRLHATAAPIDHEMG